MEIACRPNGSYNKYLYVLYVTRMYFYVTYTRMLLVCTRMYSYVPGVWFLSRSNEFICKPIYCRKKQIKTLLAGLGSVGIEKNCDLWYENAAASSSIFKTLVIVSYYTDLPAGQ